MRVEIVAVGTELLLGQIADTNSAWLGQQLSAAGVDSHFHQAVGDNPSRIVLALRTALARGDAVIVCGGLGPTHDDVTREAIAEVMNAPLVRDEKVLARVAEVFVGRGHEMSSSNARQADVPVGATVIEQVLGTAPGLICPLGEKVVYAVPGVPHEMAEMYERGILPDLRRRLSAAGEDSVIASRVLRTWGASESGLAEALGDRIGQLDVAAAEVRAPGAPGTATIAFLASGIEGIKIRLTVRAPDAATAEIGLDTEEAAVRAIIGERLGDIVFGVDDQTMEEAVAVLLVAHGLALAVAESLTGGLIASRLVDVVGASEWFRGGVVAYDSAVKYSVLGVADGPVVSEAAAAAMAEGVRRVLGSDVGLGVTGVAGPTPQEGRPPGTVCVGLALPGRPPVTRALRLPGDRARVRQYSAITALDLLRRELAAPSVAG
jgi:nicotinamide-nucleotide amidase